jgi:hypothetical protein
MRRCAGLPPGGIPVCGFRCCDLFQHHPNFTRTDASCQLLVGNVLATKRRTIALVFYTDLETLKKACATPSGANQFQISVPTQAVSKM